MDIKSQEVGRRKSIDVFCCYARKDQQYLTELEAHLMPMQRRGLITLWADVDIDAGAEWKKEIDLHLNTAHIILLLVSSDFLASDYCYTIEMQRALERDEQGEARVIPIILRPASWRETPLGKLQAMPKDAKPITKWKNRDEAFNDVSERLQNIVVNLVKGEQNRFTGEEGVPMIEKQSLSLLDQTFLPTTSPQIIMDPSLSEPQRPTIPIAQFAPIKSTIGGIRLLICWIVLILYWLLIGYTTPLIFPDEILHISGSTHLIMSLQGNSSKTQILKILVVLFSLIVDWFLAGIILSLIPHLSLLTLQDAFVYGPILVGICVFLFAGYIILYFLVKWPYTNVINLRKIIEVIAVTSLLIFASTFFGASFLYFPILASVISLCLFIYGLVSLGGTPYSDELQGSNETLKRRLKKQKERDRESKLYFEKRKEGLKR